MKKLGHRLLSLSRKDSVSSSHGQPSTSDFSQSQASTCSDYSRSLRSQKSVGVAAHKVAGSFITCFIPQHREDFQEADDEESTDQDTSFSTKVSTVSSNIDTKFKYNSSYSSKNSSQKDTTRLNFIDISKATANFSAENIIGKGGVGTVYKGKLKDGSLVAVKRARKNIYDKQLSCEFKNEIQTLSKVEHLNLVRFLGYLEHDDERIIIVEYVGNGTLQEHLDGSRGNGLDATQRLDIAVDIAHAVTYLHMYTDHPIIHRDIKASNILITEHLRAKVADFGFARLSSDDDLDATHISTQIKGTAGYVDPEYLQTYQLTEKSDVYSFGVLLVELVTGRRPIEAKRVPRDRLTIRWAMRLLQEGDALLAMDPRMRRTRAAVTAVEKMLALASECLAPSRRSRPSMKRCAEVLWDIRKGFRETELAAAAASPPRQLERASDVKGASSRSRSDVPLEAGELL